MRQIIKNIFTLLLATLLSTSSLANVLGDFQTFVPNTDGLYFVTVDSGQTLKKHTILGNAFFSYAKNYLLVNDNLTNQNLIKYKDSLTSLDGTVGYSINDDIQLFVGWTHLIEQKPESGQSTEYILSSGTHSVRPGLKWKFLASKETQQALLASVDQLNVENDPYTGVNPPAILNLGYALSTRFSGVATHGFNIGYRHRTPGEITPDSTFYPLKSQLTFSYGYSYPWSSKLRYIFETIGCYPVDKGQNKNATSISCLEVLGAARYRLNSHWAFVGGATVEPGVKTMAPDYRVFAGANMYLYPQWGKNENTKKSVSALVVPEKALIYPNESYIIPINGGQPEYQCSLIEGSPLSQINGCVFTAPPFADVARVEVTDQSGQSRIIEITTQVKEDPVKTADLTLKPEYSTVYTGANISFVTEGGNPPYTYRILEGQGAQINPETGRFKAPFNPSWITVQVTDIKNQTSTARVEVVNPAKANKTITLKGVNFIFDTTQLVAESTVKLDKAIEILKTYNIKEIIVGGHTDNIGSAEYNQTLSEKRAEAIAAILVERLNLDSAQVKSIGYGFEKPLVPNKDEESRLTNRRVELSVYTQ